MTKTKDSFIMKGEQKPISQSIPKGADKNFNINFGETKILEKKLPRYHKDPQKDQTIGVLNDSINKTTKSINMNNTQAIEDSNKIFHPQNDFSPSEQNEVAEKLSKNKTHFDIIENEIQSILARNYQEDYKNANSPSDRFLYSYFKNLNYMTINSLDVTLTELSNMVDKYYNILSEQANEFISLFYIIFDSYLHASNKIENYIFENMDKVSKFHLFHRKLVKEFFPKCQKNKSEEMNYIFRYIIIEKIFEAMNDTIYEQKLSCFCELLFYILEPFESQQFSFVKLIKENLFRDELIYDCLGHFHLLLEKNLSEQFVDGSLFYILNGFSNESSSIRYNCLTIVNTYIKNLSLNFYYNFESK